MIFTSTGRGETIVITSAAILSAGLSSSTMPPGYSLRRKSGKTVATDVPRSRGTPSIVSA